MLDELEYELALITDERLERQARANAMVPQIARVKAGPAEDQEGLGRVLIELVQEHPGDNPPTVLAHVANYGGRSQFPLAPGDMVVALPTSEGDYVLTGAVRVGKKVFRNPPKKAKQGVHVVLSSRRDAVRIEIDENKSELMLSVDGVGAIIISDKGIEIDSSTNIVLNAEDSIKAGSKGPITLKGKKVHLQGKEVHIHGKATATLEKSAFPGLAISKISDPGPMTNEPSPKSLDQAPKPGEEA